MFLPSVCHLLIWEVIWAVKYNMKSCTKPGTGHTLTITALGRLRQDNVEFETSFGCLPDFVFNLAGSCDGHMKGLVGEAMDKRA